MEITRTESKRFEVGRQFEADITDMAFGGDGVAKIDEFVVFIPFVAVGDRVQFELTEAKTRFGRGRLVRVLRPASERVEPRCRYFGTCGGCQYQHIDYRQQLGLKHKQVRDLFARIGGLNDVEIAPVVPCPEPYGYRNRMMVRSQWNGPEQRLMIGFLRHDNRLVVDVERCEIAEPALNEQLLEVRANPPERGGLKVAMRVLPDDWTVPPDTFFQNNFHLLDALADSVRQRIADSGAEYLIDAYCGVGFFAIELASMVKRFVGVEVDAPAIAAARRNAADRGVANGEFIAGRAEEMLGGLLARHAADKTAMILDPPRTGVPREALHRISNAGPAQVIYVSCNPATLARDLRFLLETGDWELIRVTPLDMFPQTQHVECVADIRRKVRPVRAPGLQSE